MVEPTGYSALDLIGFTDKGDYAPGSTYVKNDIVHYGGNMWLCKFDDTTGQTPAEGTYWTLWLESDTTLASMTDTQISSPANGDVLEYDSTGSKWKNSGTLSQLKEAFTNQVNSNGSKNILVHDFHSQKNSNVTYTVADDGKITAVVSGTSSSDRMMTITSDPSYYALGGSASWEARYVTNIVSSNGKYVLSGNPTTAGKTRIGVHSTHGVYIYIAKDIANGTYVFEPMICLKTDYDIDSTYAPPTKTNRQLTEDSVSWSDEAQIGAVNVLNNIATTQTHSSSGLTATVSDDKVITITPTSGTYPYTVPNRWILDLTTTKPDISFLPCKLSGCPSGGSSDFGSGYCIYYANYVNSTGTVVDSGNGAIITSKFDETTYPNARIMLRINASVVLTEPLVFKPMLTPVDYNGPYVPYAKTNHQLTEDSVTWSDEAQIGAVNDCPYPYLGTSSVDNEVTWTVGSDGTVTATVASTTAAQRIFDIIYVAHGSQAWSSSYAKKLIGNPSGTANNMLYVTCQTSGGSWLGGSKDEVYISANTTLNRIACVVAQGVTAGTYVFKPMITPVNYNGPYVPYAKTNKELTDALENISTGGDLTSYFKVRSADLTIYYTGNALPSDFGNLTQQERTDIAQSVYDFFKKVGGKAEVSYVGYGHKYSKKASDGTSLGSGAGTFILNSNQTYANTLANNSNARITLTLFTYGNATVEQISLWGSTMRYSRRGVVDINDASVTIKQCIGTYNTISTYKG